jgi:hypothetical protein
VVETAGQASAGTEWAVVCDGPCPSRQIAKEWLSGLSYNPAAPAKVLIRILDAGHPGCLSAHAVPGVADRSTLHWEYWRRHRTTSDGSFWWGHNSQWKTALRRDYITSRGHVYHFDALFSSFRRRMREDSADGGGRHPLTDDQASFIKNRCQLRDDNEPDFHCVNVGIDESRH